MMPSDKLEQEKERLQIIQIKQNGCSETTEAGGDGGIWGVCRSKTCSSLRLKRQGKKKRFANKNAICSNFVGLLFKLS